MFNFLHTFEPSAIAVSIGPLNLYWYGLFIVAGILAGLTLAIKLAKYYGQAADSIIDLAVWLIIGGLLGARLYDVSLEWRYFSANPLDIFKIWQGGLAIHGAIIGGLIALWLYVKKYRVDFWPLAALIVTVLPLGQAIGRWGNYFNQELFGRPTSLPWGIPIDQLHRPWQYLNFQYFQPTFLYESLGDLLIGAVMLGLHFKKPKNYRLRVAGYLILYSVLRFNTEFLRVDSTPTILSLRFPQLASLLVVIGVLICVGAKFLLKISQKLKP